MNHDLVPAERAVLKIIRVLFLEASSRTHRIALLRSRWPVLHADAYGGGFAGLMQKGLVSLSSDGQIFTVTNRGLREMSASR